MVAFRKDRPPGQKDLRYPRRGLAILPRALHSLFSSNVRHSTLTDGSRTTPVNDLGMSAWHSMNVDDCRRCAQGVVRRLNHFWAEPQRLKQMAAIPMPIDASSNVSAMEMSAILRDALTRNEIMDGRKLSAMSVYDFWNLKNVGSARLLELLGLLEDGDPSLGGTTITSAPTEFALQSIDRIMKLLGDADVAHSDVRLGHCVISLNPGRLSLRKALIALRSGAKVTGRDPWAMIGENLRLIELKLDQLKQGTLEDDLLDLLMTICKGERKAKIVAQRLGWLDGVQRTLQEVGDMVGLTRERVRQMEARAQKGLDKRSVYSPKLIEALQMARHMTPCRSDEFSQALIDRGLLRAPWPVSVFVFAAIYLGVPHGLRVIDVGNGEILADEIATAESVNRVRSIAREIAQRQGGANIKEVAFRASEELQRWVSYKETHALVGSLPDVEWLDEANGWFWCGEPAKSRVLGTIRKMLSVTSRIPIDELYEGLIRNSRMDEEQVAPKPIIQLMCAKVSWMEIVQISHVRARVPLSWAAELVGVERTLVEVLKDAGNALDHYDFKRRCMARGVPEGSFTVYEGNSPVIRRISRGIWGLRGAVVTANLLVELNEKINTRERGYAAEASRRGMERFPPGSLFGNNSYFRLYDITAATLRHHCMTLARHTGVEPGTQFDVLLDCRRIGSVVLTEDRRLRGLLPMLRNAGAKPGQTYSAKFDLPGTKIELEHMHGPTNIAGNSCSSLGHSVE